MWMSFGLYQQREMLNANRGMIMAFGVQAAEVALHFAVFLSWEVLQICCCGLGLYKLPEFFFEK